MSPTREVQYLLDLVKWQLNDKKFVVDESGVDFERVHQLHQLHALQPLNHVFHKQVGSKAPEVFLKKYEQIAFNLSVVHLGNKLEIEKIKKTFDAKNIEYRFLKGVLFTDNLYDELVRSGTDMDLYVKKTQLEPVIDILKDLRYTFTGYTNFEERKREVLATPVESGQYEVALQNHPKHIDLHWGICYSFLPYQFPDDFFFSLEDQKELIFWSILSHHGGKESWVRMKNIMDFGQFMIKFGHEMDWEKMLFETEKIKITRQLLNGFYILQKYLEIKLPEHLTKVFKTIDHSCEADLINFWNKGLYWDKPVSRWRYEKILMKSQAPNFSKTTYFYNFYKAYTIPNPFESKRLINFPKGFYFLNFLSKLTSYLIERTSKSYGRNKI